MLISERSIEELVMIVTGGSQFEKDRISPYRSGPQLVKLFNSLGENDVYGKNFPQRSEYAKGKIRALNGTPRLADLIREIFDPKYWRDFDKTQDVAVSHLNDYFKHDGFMIVRDGVFVSVRDKRGAAVSFPYPSQLKLKVDKSFIGEQASKCDRKLAEGDYDGAITNARSLLEAVLVEVEKKLLPQSSAQNDGDLIRLYKRVQRALNLEPRRPDIGEPLKQVLGGLASIVAGLAGLRNKMGDAHVRSYRPARRHAALAVNAARTLALFLLETSDHHVAQDSKKQQS